MTERVFPDVKFVDEPEQCVELANRLRWILVREREKRQNEKR